MEFATRDGAPFMTKSWDDALEAALFFDILNFCRPALSSRRSTVSHGM
jgi:hypothetical protein